MIKLIVSDLDNTLIMPNKVLPKEIIPLVLRLSEMGIRFAAASARHYDIVKKAFGEAAEYMAFVCDNGAYGEVGGEVFSHEVLSREEVLRIIDVCEGIGGTTLSLSTRDAMYYKNGTPPPIRKLHPDSINRLYTEIGVDDMRTVDAEVYRATLYDPADPIFNSIPVLKEAFGDSLSIAATDKICVDIMKNGIHKGVGVKRLQEHLGISPEETMAFGDYLNDIEMLKCAYYSVAVENALDEVKAVCRYKTESNGDIGVIKAIERLLDGDF